MINEDGLSSVSWTDVFCYAQASLAAFKQANPMYAPFADSHFTKTAKGWGIDGYVFHTLVNEALNSPMATDEVKEMAHIVLKEAKKMERQ